MKSFLKTIGAGFITFLYILSCTNDVYEASKSFISNENVEIIANPYVISKDNAIAAALTYVERSIESQHTEGSLTEIKSISTRSAGQGYGRYTSVTSKNYAVKIEEASNKSKEVRQEIPVYTINYKDENGNNAGFVVMVGDERISEKALIFSDDAGASFDMNSRSDADFIEDLIGGYLYKSINLADFNNRVTTRGGTLVIQNQPQYNTISYILTPALNFAHTITPFNKYTPFKGGVRTSAGCTAVAMSAIMAWHDWPLQGKFPRYTSSTRDTVQVSYDLDPNARDAMLSGNIAYCDSYYPAAMEYMANLCIETGYRLNTNYAGADASLASPSNVPAVFAEMGYTSSDTVKYNISIIENDIKNQVLPVFMAGWKQNITDGGHAYLIYGVMYVTVNSKVEKYIKLIEGNTTSGIYKVGGVGYVWFNAQMFSIDTSDPGYSVPSDEAFYPYRYNCLLISNIKPNYNKNGSLDAKWKARDLYLF